MAFADVTDYIARLNPSERNLSQDEQAYIGTLLADASAKLSGRLAEAGVAVDDNDTAQAANLKRVTCNMVREYLDAEKRDGYSSMSQTIGSTTASVSWSAGMTNFYISRDDELSLGIRRRSKYRSILSDTSAGFFESE